MTDPVFRDSLNPFSHLDPNKLGITYETLPTIEELIERYRDLIFEHVSRRVSFFFQQIICCFQTKLHFEIGHVVAQGASAKKVVLIDPFFASLGFERNAAHSSTLPCLIAYDAEEWALYQEKKHNFLKDGFF